MAETQEGKRRNTWIIVVVVGAILLLLLCGCLAVFVGGWLFVGRTPVAQRITTVDVTGIGRQLEVTRSVGNVFDVGTPAVLVVENEVGTVQIIGTNQDQVSVQATVHGYGTTNQAAQEAADDVSIEMGTGEGNQVRLVGEIPDGVNFGKSPSVDWIIYVPIQTMVQVQNNVGRVNVQNIVGSAVVNVNVGAIDVRGFTMTDDTSLTTDVGEIHIALPAGSVFNLNASTRVGDINSQFAVSGDNPNHPGVSKELQGTVGSNPEVTLTLHTGTGAISITKE